MVGISRFVQLEVPLSRQRLCKSLEHMFLKSLPRGLLLQPRAGARSVMARSVLCQTVLLSCTRLGCLGPAIIR